MAGAGPPQHGGGRTNCSAGGENIVHQQNPFAAHIGAAAQGKSAGHVGPALGRAQAGLRLGAAAPFERGGHGHAEPPGQRPRQQLGLIEAAPQAAPPVQRHGHHEVEALVERNGLPQVGAERFAQRFNPRVLE